MKGIVYCIIGIMGLVFLVNLSAVNGDEKVLSLNENGRILEIDPLY